MPRGRKYCSLAHRINPKKIPEDLHKEQIINRIKDFYQERKRIPVKREMYGIYKTARYLFGSWNNAVKASGLKPNPVMFSEKQIANDDHVCDSLAEKIIDDLGLSASTEPYEVYKSIVEMAEIVREDAYTVAKFFG